MVAVESYDAILNGYVEALTNTNRSIPVAAVRLFEFQCWIYCGSTSVVRAANAAAVVALAQAAIKNGASTQKLGAFVKNSLRVPTDGGPSQHVNLARALSDGVEHSRVAVNMVDFALRFNERSDELKLLLQTKSKPNSSMARYVTSTSSSYANGKEGIGKTQTQKRWNQFKSRAALLYVMTMDLLVRPSKRMVSDLVPMAADTENLLTFFRTYNEVVSRLQQCGWASYARADVESGPSWPLELDRFPSDVVEAIKRYDPANQEY